MSDHDDRLAYLDACRELARQKRMLLAEVERLRKVLVEIAQGAGVHSCMARDALVGAPRAD